MNNTPDDFTMSYMDSCDRTPILLLHGFPLDSSIWEFQFQDMQDVTRLIAPDLRGHGMSDAPEPPYSMKQLAEDCAGLLDSVGIHTPVVICGLSMGGYLAFEFYRRYPERTAGLILASTRAAADSDEGKKGRDEMITAVSANGTESIADAMLPKLLSPQTLVKDDELAEYVHDIMFHTSPEGMIGALHAMKNRQDSTPMLADIDVPTLIIHGADDQLIPVSEAQAMADAIPEAKLVVLPNAAHLPNLEQPEAFNDAIMDFMDIMHNDHNHHH